MPGVETVASPGLRRGTSPGPGRHRRPVSTPDRAPSATAQRPDPYSARPKSVMESSSYAAVGHHRGEAAEILEVDRLCLADFPEDQPIPQRACKPQPYPVTAPMPTMPAAPSTFTMCTSLRATFGTEQPGYSRPPRPTVEQRLLPSSLTVDDLERKAKDLLYATSATTHSYRTGEGCSVVRLDASPLRISGRTQPSAGALRSERS